MRSDNKTSIIANAYEKMIQDRFAPQNEVTTTETEVVEETPEEVVEESPEVETTETVAEVETEEEPSIFSPAELDAIKRHMG